MQKASASGQQSDAAYGVKEKLTHVSDIGMDLITFEVMRNAFVAACYEASTTIERVAYHPVVGMGRDRSNALLTKDGRLVAHGHTDAAAHYASFGPSVVELIKDRPVESMQRGDTFLFSDPYRTGSHVNDTRLIRPIFFDDQVVAFACTVIHWADAARCRAPSIRKPPPVTPKASASRRSGCSKATCWTRNCSA